MTGTLREEQCTLLIISRLILPIMRNVSDKSCRENQNTHFVFSNYFFSENRAVYEVMWKNMATVGQATDDNIVWRMRIAYSITKATNTHSAYVIHIAFA